MPDRELIIKEFRTYYAWAVGTDWAHTTLAQACKAGADLLEEDRERIKALENTVNHALEVLKAHGWKDETEVTGNVVG